MTEMLKKEFSRKTFLQGRRRAGRRLLDGRRRRRRARPPRPPRIRTRRPARRPALIDSWLAIHADNTVTAQARQGRARPGHAHRPADDRGRGARRRRSRQIKSTSIIDTNVTPNQGATVGSSGIAERRPAGARRGGGRAERAARPRGDEARRPGGEPDRDERRRRRRRPHRHLRRAARRQALQRRRMPAARRASAPGAPRQRSRSPSTRSSASTGMPRVDIPEKVSGTFTYVHNIRVPGMLHGRVVRPRGQGAYGDGTAPKVLSVDESSIKHITARRSCASGTSSASSLRPSTRRSRPPRSSR